MKNLHLYTVSDVDQLAWPENPEEISLLTPAIRFFTDFDKVEPLVIDASTLSVDVKNLMIKSHVKLKIVVDRDLQFLGVISLDELADRRIIQRISEGFGRNDLAVTDLMIPKSELRAFDYSEISRATIGDIIHSLQDSGQHHCLVVDLSSHKIRGIFSASDISRKLRLPIDIQSKPSFYKVFSVTRN